MAGDPGSSSPARTLHALALPNDAALSISRVMIVAYATNIARREKLRDCWAFGRRLHPARPAGVEKQPRTPARRHAAAGSRAREEYPFSALPTGEAPDSAAGPR